MFRDFNTSRDVHKKNEGWEISRKSSIWIFPGTTGSFEVQSLQTFFVLSFWDFKTSRDIHKKNEGCEISRKSSIWIFPGTTGSFWVQRLQTFFVLFFLGL
jgi:hypothetical protein